MADFVHSSLRTDDFLLHSSTLPDDVRFRPPIGNGHIATNVLSDTVYMNGLYNGFEDRSSRARVPAYVSLDVTKENDVSRECTLDMYNGLFRQTVLKPNVEINVTYLVHRKLSNLMVTRLDMRRHTYSDSNITIGLQINKGAESEDLHIIKHDAGAYRYTEGVIREPETNGTAANKVHVFYSHIPGDVSFTEGKSEMTFTFIASYSQDWGHALHEFLEANGDEDWLIESHVQEMQNIWKGHIYINGNNELMQNITAAMYHIMCSLPADDNQVTPFYGLGPGGLSRGGLLYPEKPGGPSNDYAGHVFWDMDTWIMPPIMLFHPDMARRMLGARLRVIDQARLNAQQEGFDGIKFPWEQAATGIEVTPKWAGQMALYQLHVNSDISYSLRQYLYVTDDDDVITQGRGLELALEIARFWRSRVTEADDNVHILGVMGPDEYHYNINNSVFTNYNAKLSLLLPRYIIQHYKIPVNKSVTEELDVFESLANKMYILFDDEEQYHPQYDGFSFNYTIKQSDVVLLGYPLMMEMSPEVRRNDLDLYEKVTEPQGPDTGTWSMHTVGWLELGDAKRAEQNLQMMFRNINGPFKVFSEKPVTENAAGGCVNFITGAGGLLQAIVFGYGGMRLHPDRLEIRPYLLPNTSSWGMRGVHYREVIFDLDIQNEAVTILVTHQPRALSLYLEYDSGERRKIDKGSPVLFGKPGSSANLKVVSTVSTLSTSSAGTTKYLIPAIMQCMLYCFLLLSYLL